MGNHVSGKRLGGLVVVGERGCDVERSIDEDEEDEPGRGDEERPPKVLKGKRGVEKNMFTSLDFASYEKVDC